MQLQPNSPTPPRGITSITLLTCYTCLREGAGPGPPPRINKKGARVGQYSTRGRLTSRASGRAALMFSSDAPTPVASAPRLEAAGRGPRLPAARPRPPPAFSRRPGPPRLFKKRAQVFRRGVQVVENRLALLREARAGETEEELL